MYRIFPTCTGHYVKQGETHWFMPHPAPLPMVCSQLCPKEGKNYPDAATARTSQEKGTRRTLDPGKAHSPFSCSPLTQVPFRQPLGCLHTVPGRPAPARTAAETQSLSPAAVPEPRVSSEMVPEAVMDFHFLSPSQAACKNRPTPCSEQNTLAFTAQLETCCVRS